MRADSSAGGSPGPATLAAMHGSVNRGPPPPLVGSMQTPEIAPARDRLPPLSTRLPAGARCRGRADVLARGRPRGARAGGTPGHLRRPARRAARHARSRPRSPIAGREAPGDAAAADLVADRFDEIATGAVSEQRFEAYLDGDDVELRNVLLTLPGEASSDGRDRRRPRHRRSARAPPRAPPRPGSCSSSPTRSASASTRRPTSSPRPAARRPARPAPASCSTSCPSATRSRPCS